MKLRLVAFLAVAMCAGCSGQEASRSEAPKAQAPAKLSGDAVKEAQLATITLTEDAEKRLGISLGEVRMGSGAEVRRFTGEVTKPVGSNVVVSSSVAGTLQAAPGGLPATGSTVQRDQQLFVLNPFLPLPRDLAVTAEGDVAQARTRVETAQQRKARADRMLADEVGTVRLQEEAQQEVALATTALRAAENRLKEIQSAPFTGNVSVQVHATQSGVLRQIFAFPGQTVAAGQQLFEIEDLHEVWLRVPVYAGEAQSLIARTNVTVQPINAGGGTAGSWLAQPVAAPPSADSASSTVDFYYSLPNDDLRFKPGQKLLVAIPSTGSRSWLQAPWSSIAYDTNGGTWVYESFGDRNYARRRVELDHVSGGIAFLNAGVSPGIKVVVDGAAELWGFEFGTGK